MKKMLIGALTLSLAVAASAGALAEKYNLMFSHTLTENDPYHQAFVQLCAGSRRVQRAVHARKPGRREEGAAA